MKAVFGRPVVAAGLFQAYLDPRITRLLDWASLRVESGSLIDETMRTSYTDLLFAVRMNGQPVAIHLLLEHQSRSDGHQVFRMGSYQFKLWSNAPRQAGERSYPLIIPVVVHQGNPWTAPRRVSELVKLPEGLTGEESDLLRRWRPDFEFEVIDLPQRDLREIRGHIAGRVALALMQAASQGRVEEFFQDYGEMTDELLRQPDVMGIVRTLLIYATQRAEDRSRLMALFQRLPNIQLRESAMSVADQLKAEGRLEGQIDTIVLLLENRFGTLR